MIIDKHFSHMYTRNLRYRSLSELSAAVKYVSKNSDGKIFSDPLKIISFFKDMDIVSVMLNVTFVK